jgi:hypothetical protein
VDGKHTVSCHLSAEDRLRLWDTEIRPNL